MIEFVAMSLDQQAAVVTNNGGVRSGSVPPTATRKDKRDIIWKEVPHG